jgi:hypothetical protein
MNPLVSASPLASVSSRPRFPRSFLALAWAVSFAVPASNAANLIASSFAELQAALVAAISGDTVLIRAGVYPVTQPLVVKDGVTVLGEGSMGFAQNGLPAGFALPGQTILQAESTLTGDVITLGNGTIMSALILHDGSRSGGNLVAVSTRAPGDTISATILECELFNPNGAGVGPQGPTGRVLAVISRNLNMAAPPSPDDDSNVHVRVLHSIVHAPRGTAVFANNFASRCAIRISLTGNVVGGPLDIVGGTSRPDSVTDSSVTIESRGNLYWCENPIVRQTAGWSIIGGATPPFLAGAGTATRNRVRVLSLDDRIEGFVNALVATGGQRYFPNAGPIVSNHVELILHGISLQSSLSDLTLAGGRSSFDGSFADADADNSLRVTMTQAVGSGVRQNTYAHQLGIWPGNHLEITGSPTSFGQVNDSIDAPPPVEFFASKSKR